MKNCITPHLSHSQSIMGFSILYSPLMSSKVLSVSSIILFVFSFLFTPENLSCAWVAAAVGAGLGVLSSLYGGSKAAKEARKARRMLAEQEAKEKAWYERRYNQDYADTAAGQRLLTQARDFAKSNWKKAEGTNRVAGGTDARVAQAKEAGTKMVGDTISQIAANDTARKDAIDTKHLTNQANFTQQKMAIQNQKAANITDAAQNASNALIQAGALVDSAGAAAKAPKTTQTTPAIKTVTPQSPEVLDRKNWFWEGLDLA